MNDNSLPPGFLAGLESLSRRRFLVDGVKAVALAGAALALPGRVLAAGAGSDAAAGHEHLSDLEYRVFDKLRIIMLPTQKYSLPSSTEIPVMQNVDSWVGKLGPRPRMLVSLGAKTIEYGSLYRFSRFSQMSDDTAIKHMHNWQTGSAWQRGVMSSLKMLVTLGFWQDVRTWPSLQYDGPVSEKWGLRRLGNAPVPH